MRIGVLASCVVMWSASAFADRADELVAQGQELATHGQLADAIAKFNAADTLQPRARNTCLIGLAYLRASRPIEAELSFAACRARATATDPVPEWLAKTTSELAAELAAAQLVEIDLVVEGGITMISIPGVLDGAPFAPPSKLHLSAGKHAIIAYRPGTPSVTHEVEVAPGAARTITLEPLPPPPAARAEPAHSRWPVLLAVGGLGLGAVGGTIQLAAMLPARDRAATTTDHTAYTNDISTFHTDRAVVIGCYAVGVAAIVAGLVLRARDHDREHGVAFGAAFDHQAAWLVMELRR